MKVRSPQRALAVLSVGLAVSVAACGSGGSTTRPPTASPVSTDSPGVTLLGDSGASFTDSVPETPWWRAPKPSPQSHAPVSLAWNLSGDVLFDSGSATLSDAAGSQLQGIVAEARQHPGATITVVGYTDNVPDSDFPGDNQGLSEARAAAVAAVFTQAQIAGDHVTSGGEGSSVPAGDESTAAGRQANRRVTISLTVP